MVVFGDGEMVLELERDRPGGGQVVDVHGEGVLHCVQERVIVPVQHTLGPDTVRVVDLKEVFAVI